MTDGLAGWAGGCAGVLVGHPLDTVKVKLQTQNYLKPQYKGTWDCFAQTIKKDGFLGLYRGMASPMVGVGAVTAIIFSVQGAAQRSFKDQNALSTIFLSGVAAGVTQSFICSPVELTKTRIQLQADKLVSTSSTSTSSISSVQHHKGPFQCLQAIFRKEGFRGVFRGQLVTIMREVPAFGSYFLSYEVIARQMSGKPTAGEANSQTILLAGGLAGIVSWVVSYPIDVVKTRIQSDGAFGPTRYQGIMHCAVTSVREEGPKVLTRGINSSVIRAFPTNAATFFVVSAVVKNCNKESSPESVTVPETPICQVKKLTPYGEKKMNEVGQCADLILTSSKLAQEVLNRTLSTLNRIKENHVANFLPVVIANTRETLTYSIDHEEVLSLNQDSVSLNQDAVSLNQDTVSSIKDTVSLNQDTVSPIKDTASLNQDTASLNQDSASNNQDTVFLNQDSASLNQDSASHSQEVPSYNPSKPQSLDAILHCPVQKAAVRFICQSGIVAQATWETRSALLSQQILSLVL